MLNYLTIKQSGTVETTIKKSRFITHLARVSNEEEARAIIAAIKKNHYKANHSCSAFIIGEQGELKRSSDDGEPSGTAGIPMLSVLEKQGLTNTLAVVTRYFGGIKLGTGGLIRAYSTCVSEAIAELGQVAIKEQAGIAIQLSYSQYQRYEPFLAKVGLEAGKMDFGQEVIAQLFFAPEKEKQITKELIDYYQGQVSFEKIAPQIIEVPFTK
ncbi:YigZ family protein [Streptococcus halichoeri]|uniref:YigZ family protein n=1 Tax=Streptococcus halichoeri TaxID=254785 RepID=UPI00135692CD|nr:YigZ family protein [Streptococcus halichoeri]